MGKLKNEFSWSGSRKGKLDGCARAYYWNHYGSWDGWLRGSPEVTQKAYRLKNMTNRWMFKGNLVHDTMEQVLRTLMNSNRSITLEEAVTYMESLARTRWKQSKTGKFRGTPKQSTLLIEHHLQNGRVNDGTLEETITDCTEQLENFFGSGIWVAIQAGTIMDVESLIPIYVNGIKTFIKMDLMFCSTKNKTCIVDWKTGKRYSSYADQLGVYGYYANRELSIELEDLRLIDVFLAEQEITGDPGQEIIKLTKGNINKYVKTMEDSVAEMAEYLVDGDTSRNKPLPIEEFPMTTKKSYCDYCNFREICYGKS